MTGREKIEAAFSPDGAIELPVVICYERLFIRDHLTEFSFPWHYWYSSDVNELLHYRSEVIESTGQDWFQVWPIETKDQRAAVKIEKNSDGFFKVNKSNGTKERISKPAVAGTAELPKFVSLPSTRQDIEAAVPPAAFCNPADALMQGRWDLAIDLIQKYGKECFSLFQTSSPFWSCFGIWGFENTMMMVTENPDLLLYACQQQLMAVFSDIEQAAMAGAHGVWVEECFSDSISCYAYNSIVLPFLKQIFEHIRELRLKSIYYYCGDPWKKLDLILSAGADAVAFEEGKKNFSIDIEDIVSHVQGRCTILGNMDSIDVLQDGTGDELKVEIKRQLTAGRKNKSRFIMNLGSPVTPSTPLTRVRQFCNIVHEYGV